MWESCERAKAERREWSEHMWVRLPKSQGQGGLGNMRLRFSPCTANFYGEMGTAADRGPLRITACYLGDYCPVQGLGTIPRRPW